MTEKRHLHYVGFSWKKVKSIKPRAINNAEDKEFGPNNFSTLKKNFKENLSKLLSKMENDKISKDEAVKKEIFSKDIINKFRKFYLVINLKGRIWTSFINDFKKRYSSTELKYFSNFNRTATLHLSFEDIQKFIKDMKEIIEYEKENPEVFVGDNNLFFLMRISSFDYYSIEDRLKTYNFSDSTYSVQFFRMSSKDSEEIENLIKEDIDIKKITPLISEINIKTSNKEETLWKYLTVLDDIQFITSGASIFIDKNDQRSQIKSDFVLSQNINISKLPTVGIIDSGIFDGRTTLRPLIDREKSESRIDNEPFVDSQNHGTGVASLVTFGKQITNNQSTLTPFAKIASIKILGSENRLIHNEEFFNIIKDFYEKGIRVFNLSVNLDVGKEENEGIKQLTYLLDYALYHYNDILFFISAGNLSQDDINYLTSKYNETDTYRFHSGTNIAVPADSRNAIVVGSLTIDNKVSGFSRRNNIDYGMILSSKQDDGKSKITRRVSTISKYNYKPDVLFQGENVKMLDSNYTEEVKVDQGTSFSSPLVCNIAVKIMSLYPELNANSIKAILINASSKDGVELPLDTVIADNLPNEIKNRIQFPYAHSEGKSLMLDKEKEFLKQRYLGFGEVLEERALYSSDKRVSFVIQDDIKINEIRTYKIKIPHSSIFNGKGKLILRGSLCYNHIPILCDHLNYNPIHMSFKIISNVTDLEGTSEDEELPENTILNRSQDNYYDIQYANHQKKEHNFLKNSLLNKIDDCLYLQVRCNLKLTDFVKQEICDYIFANYGKIIDTENDFINQVNNQLTQSFGFCLTIEDLADSGNDIYTAIVNENIGILEELNETIDTSTQKVEEINIDESNSVQDSVEIEL